MNSNSDAQEKLCELLWQDCWSKTRDIRGEFEETQHGKKRTRLLTEEIKKHAPVAHDLQKLKLMYDSAYSKSAKLYDKFHTIREVSILDNIPNSNILSIAIVNIAKTELAAFLEYLDATEWFRQGHEKYSEKAAGKCPYCSRPLPDNFEQYVTASLDTWYKENLRWRRQLVYISVKLHIS